MSEFTLLSTSPSSGISLTPIEIRGTFFHGKIDCNFDRRHLVPAHIINSTLMECIVPSQHTPGIVSVDIEVNGKSITKTNPFNFTVKDISIASISPSYGSIKGGTMIEITILSGQANDISHCRFDDTLVPVTAHSERNVTMLTCLSPKTRSPGVVVLEVSSNGKDSTSNHHLFEYIEDLELLEIEPNSGPESGDTVVLLKGRNFPQKDNLSCNFGSSSVAARWLSESEITCISPVLKPGGYGLSVSSNGIDKGQENLTFTSFVKPSLTHLSSSSFTTGAKEIIVLGGINFLYSPNLFCRLDDQIFPATFVNENEILCTVPQHFGSQKKAVIGVSFNGQDVFDTLEVVRYPRPEVTHVEPTSVPLKGGNISVQFNFDGNISQVLCKFGDSLVEAILSNNSTLKCICPENKIIMIRDTELSISVDGGVHWSNVWTISYRKLSQIHFVY